MEVMVKPAKLQPFLGERDHRTVLAWLFEAEAKVRHYAGSDVEAVHVSASYFRGDALNWWRVLSERAALPGSWTEFSRLCGINFSLRITPAEQGMSYTS